MNPRARYRDPITVDDVLASPMSASPLHKLDCCLVTDGAGAFVHDVSAERARDLARSRRSTCSAPATAHTHIDDQPDARPDRRPPAPCRGPRAFEMAGVKPSDVDVLMATTVHDHRAAAPRGPRVLPEGRGRPVRRDGRHRAGRRAADEHQRRRALLHAPGHVRDVPRSSRPTRQLRGECGAAAGRRRRDRRRPRLRGRAVAHVHRRARHGGGALMATRSNRRSTTRPTPSGTARRERAASSAVVHRLRRPDLLVSARRVPDAASHDASSGARVGRTGNRLRGQRPAPARQPADGRPGPYAVALVELGRRRAHAVERRRRRPDHDRRRRRRAPHLGSAQRRSQPRRCSHRPRGRPRATP